MAKKRSAGRNGGVKKAQQLVDAVNKQVAENISDSTVESALLPPGNPGEFSGDTSNTTRKEGKMDITFKHKSTQKNGINTYSAEGYGGSIYLNKSLFAGPPPAEITVSAPDGTFAQGTARAPKDASPERVAKAEEKLRKAQERQAKQAESLKKQQELVERLKQAQGQTASA
jgi:hypothetical protein